jgi:hypothetical protein
VGPGTLGQVFDDLADTLIALNQHNVAWTQQGAERFDVVGPQLAIALSVFDEKADRQRYQQLPETTDLLDFITHGTGIVTLLPQAMKAVIVFELLWGRAAPRCSRRNRRPFFLVSMFRVVWGCPATKAWVGSRPMPRSSPSTKTQRGATLFNFVPFLVRRVLGPRIGSRGVLLARSSSLGVITVVHRQRDHAIAEVVDLRIGQLRPNGDRYQLFWKKGNGRWTAYYDERGERFVGSLAECLEEISRDPFGCYWT